MSSSANTVALSSLESEKREEMSTDNAETLVENYGGFKLETF